MPQQHTQKNLFDLKAPPSAAAVARVVGVTRQCIQEMLSNGKLPFPETNHDLLRSYIAYRREECFRAGYDPDTGERLKIGSKPARHQ